ncbi:Uncharacterised protein [Legionella lansingensis]|uniref:Uncharacterized protein n=1 Tax=Legionella lansingensis TaxID=45067 RepID=A0A0W0VJI4_9GAMM|nr:hypothetical protein [Legionella lansingensis]KTD20267.1 hypothetical protein Llan_1918 [Legionella lansingensis]SNV50272.1 Uncharacterised protein [Legionella lansingensis]
MTIDVKGSLSNQEAYYALIEENSSRAMQYLMLREEANYLQEIDKLAQNCSYLLTHLDENIDFVINRMEISMTANYLHCLKEVDREINACQDKKTKLPANQFYGENEFNALNRRIRDLEQSKSSLPQHLMEGVVKDALARADIHYEIGLEEKPY